jgi:hypothetical protein
MEDLIKKLQTEAGLTEEQAIKSLGVIKDHIMSMVPPMMHPMIENFMGQQETMNDDDPLK